MSTTTTPTPTQEDVLIARTIMEQLGGNKFRVMTGAKDFVCGPGGTLRFKLPMKPHYVKDGWNVVEVVLTPMDVYTVTFFKYSPRSIPWKLLAEEKHEDIYAEDLRSLFERVTGLATTMGSMGRRHA